MMAENEENEEEDDMDMMDNETALEESKSNSIGLPQQKFDKNVAGTTQRIVQSQQIKGEWNFDQSLLNTIGATNIDALKAKVADLTALMTIIVVAWLENHADKNAVSMIISKATGFLRRANITNYKDLIQEAQAIV